MPVPPTASLQQGKIFEKPWIDVEIDERRTPRPKPKRAKSVPYVHLPVVVHANDSKNMIRGGKWRDLFIAISVDERRLFRRTVAISTSQVRSGKKRAGKP